MVTRALELAMREAEAAEVSLREERKSDAEYENDLLKRVEASQTSSLLVRVIAKGRLGLAAATDPAEYESVVARAVELAEFGTEAKFVFPAPATAPAVETYDESVELIAREELVATGGEMVKELKAYNPEIKVYSGAGWSRTTRRLVNSNGLDISTRGTHYGDGVEGILIRGTDMLFAGRSRSWRKRPDGMGRMMGQTVQDFRFAERMATVTTKTMPVIFTPRGTRVLTLPIQLGVNGKNVLKGDSPLAGKLGQCLCGAAFSLTDDGTIDYAPDSSRYDGEGVPRRRNEIIRNGVLQRFLYDLETAGKAGTESTGNGVGCGPANLLIAAGDASFEEMVKSTEEGVMVESVLGLGQGNIINGDFSVNVALGYKIEKGEIVGRVKNTMIAGNAYKALNCIEAIGSECEWFGSHCAPYIKIAGLSVVAKEG
jgi:PmbA protein